MIRSKEELLTVENVKLYFNALEKRFLGESLADVERELTREINIAADYDPGLEKKLLKVFLAPVASTFSGLKLLFHEKETDAASEENKDYLADLTEQYSDSEWNLIRRAAAANGKLYNTLREKIDHLDLGRLEAGKDTRKFFIEMPLAPDMVLHLEVVRIGTQWLAIPFASCDVIYMTDDGVEKMQTRFKSLSLKLGELKNKGIFLADGKIVIKG